MKQKIDSWNDETDNRIVEIAKMSGDVCLPT
jgi:hypothetical protein